MRASQDLLRVKVVRNAETSHGAFAHWHLVLAVAYKGLSPRSECEIRGVAGYKLGDFAISRAARARKDWFVVAVAQSQIIFVVSSLIFGSVFLATPGSSEDIFLNFFAVGFIQSVDNLVVEALRKSPFSRDADQEWEVQVEYRTLPNWCGNAFMNVLGPFGYGLLCAFVYLGQYGLCHSIIDIGQAVGPLWRKIVE